MHDELRDIVTLNLDVDRGDRPRVEHGLPNMAIQFGAGDVKGFTGQSSSDSLNHNVIHAVDGRL